MRRIIFNRVAMGAGVKVLEWCSCDFDCCLLGGGLWQSVDSLVNEALRKQQATEESGAESAGGWI